MTYIARDRNRKRNLLVDALNLAVSFDQRKIVVVSPDISQRNNMSNAFNILSRQRRPVDSPTLGNTPQGRDVYRFKNGSSVEFWDANVVPSAVRGRVLDSVIYDGTIPMDLIELIEPYFRGRDQVVFEPLRLRVFRWDT
jgi:hypothetical protein